MRIAEFSESSKFWTHIALSGYAWEYACISVRKSNLPFFFCVVSDWNGRIWSVLKVRHLLDHQVLLNWHCLSILLLWSVAHDAVIYWSLARVGDFGENIIEETTICGMFGFGWQSCLLCVESVLTLRCTDVCGLERWLSVYCVTAGDAFSFEFVFRKQASWESMQLCCISVSYTHLTLPTILRV